MVHAALSTQDNGKRPGRYILLQEMENRVVWGEPCQLIPGQGFYAEEAIGAQEVAGCAR